MNSLDIGILVLLGLCALAGYRRGLIRTVYRLVSFVVAMFLSYRLYPYVARFLRDTALFNAIQSRVSTEMNLEGFFVDYTGARHAEIINSLPLPAFLRDLLYSFNTPDMYAILRVHTLEDYISGFFANIVMNGIAIVAVFIVVLLILSVVGAVLDVVSMLPVIYSLNRIGGLAIGVVMGIGIVWLSIVVVTILISTGTPPEVQDLLDNSFIVRTFFSAVLPRLTTIIW